MDRRAMAKATIRISDKARKVVRDLADQRGQSMQAVLDDAVEAYRRQAFLEKANACYGRLGADRHEAQDAQDELAEWEQATIADGLEDHAE